MLITQLEANKLIAMQKIKEKSESYNFPFQGEILNIPLVSKDKRESFLITVNRGKKQFKCSYLERYDKVIILVRLDLDGPPHINPDEVPNISEKPLSNIFSFYGQIIQCPHLHLFVEGYDDKWAIPALSEIFPRTKDLYKTLEDFLSYCNIVDIPLIIKRLF
jgi:hypothetical protein